MTNKQAEKLVKKEQWQDLLIGMCKNNSLTVEFIDLSDKCKRIEIKDGGIDLIETLQSTQPEENFNEISNMMLYKLFKGFDV